MELTESKQKIVTVARKVFGRLGFNKTTMTDIAHAAKRGRRTIYMHFKNKEDVYEAVLVDEIKELSEKIASSIAEIQDEKIKLKHYIIKRMIFVRDLLNYHDALRHAFFEDHNRFAMIRKEFDKNEHEFIHEILESGKCSGSFRNIDTELTTQNIMITIKAFEMPVFKENYSPENEKQLNNIIDILLNGISG